MFLLATITVLWVPDAFFSRSEAAIAASLLTIAASLQKKKNSLAPITEYSTVFLLQNRPRIKRLLLILAIHSVVSTRGREANCWFSLFLVSVFAILLDR